MEAWEWYMPFDSQGDPEALYHMRRSFPERCFAFICLACDFLKFRMVEPALYGRPIWSAVEIGSRRQVRQFESMTFRAVA